MVNLNEKLSVKVMSNPKTGEVWTPRTIVDSRTGEERDVAIIMLSQVSFNDGGIGGLSKRTAFKTYELDVVELLGDLKEGETFPIPGKLVVNETLEPYIRKDGSTQEPKRKGKGGDIIYHNGQPVYRNTEFTTDLNAQDVFLRETKASEVPAQQQENETPA